jgi:hypothetical protein
MLSDIKTREGCSLCKSTNTESLCFYHTDLAGRPFLLSAAGSKSFSRIHEELKRCVVLCRDCYIENHGEVATKS